MPVLYFGISCDQAPAVLPHAREQACASEGLCSPRRTDTPCAPDPHNTCHSHGEAQPMGKLRIKQKYGRLVPMRQIP